MAFNTTDASLTDNIPLLERLPPLCLFNNDMMPLLSRHIPTRPFLASMLGKRVASAQAAERERNRRWPRQTSSLGHRADQIRENHHDGLFGVIQKQSTKSSEAVPALWPSPSYSTSLWNFWMSIKAQRMRPPLLLEPSNSSSTTRTSCAV